MYTCNKHGWVSFFDPCPSCVKVESSVTDTNIQVSFPESTPSVPVALESKKNEMYMWLDDRFELTFADKSLIAQFLFNISTPSVQQGWIEVEKRFDEWATEKGLSQRSGGNLAISIFKEFINEIKNK